MQFRLAYMRWLAKNFKKFKLIARGITASDGLLACEDKLLNSILSCRVHHYILGRRVQQVNLKPLVDQRNLLPPSKKMTNLLGLNYIREDARIDRQNRVRAILDSSSTGF